MQAHRHMRCRRDLSRRLLLSAVVGVVCCAGPTEETGGRQPVVDLAAVFPFTENRPATRRIDFGQPRDRASLGGGWAERGTLADGTGGRSNAASVTRLSFDAGQDLTSLRVSLRARVDLPPTRSDSQQRALSTVRIRINNALAATIVASEELQAHAFDVPRELLRLGRNEMTLKHVGTIDPRGNRPRRGSTFFYESIVFEPMTPVFPGPHLAQDGLRLILPPGAEAPFFFRVPAGAELRLSVEPPEALSVLRVSVEADAGSPRRLMLRGDRESSAAIPLPEGSLARLTFGVPSDGPQASLVRPTVWGRQGTAPEAVGHAPPAGQDANVTPLRHRYPARRPAGLLRLPQAHVPRRRPAGAGRGALRSVPSHNRHGPVLPWPRSSRASIRCGTGRSRWRTRSRPGCRRSRRR